MSQALQHWPDKGWVVDASWQPLMTQFMTSDAGQRLQAFVRQRLQAGACVYPPQPLRMLSLTALDDVRVVILGQDPYHGPGQAEGLAFSVAPGQRIPPSLRNIYKELARDLGGCAPSHGSLVPWAQQGVLLLNTCLTVEQGRPASHARQGWEVLTSAVLQACNAHPAPKVFMLWGAHAQALRPYLEASRHLVLSANHPSPLSANRPPVPFVGCGHFGQANRWLAEKNLKFPTWLPHTEKTVA